MFLFDEFRCVYMYISTHVTHVVLFVLKMLFTRTYYQEINDFD